MTIDQVLALAGNFGPMGLFVAYLIYREQRNDATRMQYDTARLECDKQLAASLATLAAVIQGRN